MSEYLYSWRHTIFNLLYRKCIVQPLLPTSIVENLKMAMTNATIKREVVPFWISFIEKSSRTQQQQRVLLYNAQKQLPERPSTCLGHFVPTWARGGARSRRTSVPLPRSWTQTSPLWFLQCRADTLEAGVQGCFDTRGCTLATRSGCMVCWWLETTFCNTLVCCTGRLILCTSLYRINRCNSLGTFV